MFQEWLKDYEKLRENNTMSEKEIIKEINIIKETIIGILKIDTENYIEDIYNIDTKQFKAILGLLDLYNKEKEKNKKIEDKIKGKIEWYQQYCDLDYQTVRALEDILE